MSRWLVETLYDDDLPHHGICPCLGRPHADDGRWGNQDVKDAEASHDGADLVAVDVPS